MDLPWTHPGPPHPGVALAFMAVPVPLVAAQEDARDALGGVVGVDGVGLAEPGRVTSQDAGEG